ncbi:hypothetical protein [Helicobacter bilis]|uniref:hypothetical protein n=1 Tax=Helicobacter bilis TaxID=37372 RepID=UPI00068FE5A8|nr:hypothetical protein [Helicobacter bilis]MCI7411977.1 hypothetical protein [Helicobacter bilis]MDD7296427.1 hypothetical protein [Helicobacter bilis]MDY4399066.1 hypothetical protein [Helicobacter bilis]
MAEREGSTVGFEPLDSQQQWDQAYAILTTTENAGEIISIIGNASSDEIGYYQDKAFNILFCSTEATTGFLEYLSSGVSMATAGAAGGFTAATLGTSTVATTTGGIFGLFATTTVATVAAPVTLIAGATLGGIALGYGAYKLISNSAKDKGKEEHFKETKQQGRYNINPVRTLNPFVLFHIEGKSLIEAYEILAHSSPSQRDMEDFLKIFDANAMLNANLVQKGIEEGHSSVEKTMRNQFKSYLLNYVATLKRRYKTTNKDLIHRYIAFVEFNNEYITPRVVQAEKREMLDGIQKGSIVGITENDLKFEEFRALFSMYKMLLNHSQNTSKQIKLQKEKMYERAKEFGATEMFEEILAEHRLVKLDETNYIRYLQEVVSVLDSKEARAFINDLANDISEYMLVDSVMEPYEKEIMQNIANTFSNLLDTSSNRSATKDMLKADGFILSN